MGNQFDDWVERQRCFLCTRAATVTFPKDFYIECERCGRFHFERLLTRTMEGDDMKLLPYLSIHTREASDRGENGTLDSGNWKELALAGKNITFEAKVQKLLKLAGERSRPGHIAKFNEHTDPPLVGAADVGVFGALFEDLVNNDYADMPESWRLRLKGKAWKELEAANTPPKVPQVQHAGSDYVNTARIEELRALKNAAFDMSKLIRTCEELNICYAQGCYLAVAMLVRSVLDHVPPLFGCNGFAEVANNYNGSRSFKESMVHLENSSRKIADSHLHQRIRKSESLPNKTQ